MYVSVHISVLIFGNGQKTAQFIMYAGSPRGLQSPLQSIISDFKPKRDSPYVEKKKKKKREKTHNRVFKANGVL